LTPARRFCRRAGIAHQPSPGRLPSATERSRHGIEHGDRQRITTNFDENQQLKRRIDSMSHKPHILRWFACLAIAALPLAGACGQSAPAPEGEATQPDPNAGLRDALLFHAGFDNGPDAAFAKGDARLYTAPNYKEVDKAAPGIGNPDVEITNGAGKFGNALTFKKKNEHAVFYRADNNMPLSSGTVSFWLSLDPEVDLEPGFVDPIQITDTAYNDGAIWVDFPQAKPRPFRLGVFGDLSAWNPDNLPQDKNPIFDNRLVVVAPPPFARGKWTHVVITYEGLGSPQGMASLYLDGRLQGSKTGIAEAFTVDMAKTQIRLGVNYGGMFDELAVFNRPLTEAEVQQLGALPGGVSNLHP
jgi:hypothetical protein